MDFPAKNIYRLISPWCFEGFPLWFSGKNSMISRKISNNPYISHVFSSWTSVDQFDEKTGAEGGPNQRCQGRELEADG